MGLLLAIKWCASSESCYSIFCMYTHVYEICVYAYVTTVYLLQERWKCDLEVPLIPNKWRRQDQEIGALYLDCWWAVVDEITTGHNRQVCFEFVLHVMRYFYMFVYLITGKMTEQRWKIYSRCLPLAVVMRTPCTHVRLLNAVERMSLDVAQFQHM